MIFRDVLSSPSEMEIRVNRIGSGRRPFPPLSVAESLCNFILREMKRGIWRGREEARAETFEAGEQLYCIVRNREERVESPAADLHRLQCDAYYMNQILLTQTLAHLYSSGIKPLHTQR